jgi:hypothetical protein
MFIFVSGFVLGALVVYKIEEHNFKAMKAQCESLVIEESRLRQEREEYYKTREMVDTIDDLPEYLRDKYYIPEKQTFTDSDEDISEIYI